MVNLSFLTGGGEMGALIRAHDWHQHPLRSPQEWPQSLRTAVRILLNSGHQMALFWGEDGFWFYNDAYRKTLTAERHPSSLGLPVRQVWPEVWEEIGSQIAQVMGGGSPTWHENQHLVLHRNGRDEDTYWTYSYSPVDDDTAARGVGGVLVVASETTAYVMAANRVVEERQKFSELFEQAPSFMAMLRGPDHVFEMVNPSYLRLIGNRDVLGRALVDAVPEATGQGFSRLLDEVYASGKSYVARGASLVTQAGLDSPVDQRYIDFVYQPIKDRLGNVTGIFVDGSDVTEHIVAEQALRTSDARLRALNADLEQQVARRIHTRSRTWQLSTDMIGVINAEGFFEETNPAWQTILGWPTETIVSTHFVDFLHPDDVLKSQRAFTRAVELGEPMLQFQNRYRHADGGYRWLTWVAIPENGKIYCSARDVTTEKEAAEALEVTEAALRQSQKMEAVGQLTGGIAHDFNNLLGGILGAMEIARIKLDQGKHQDLPHYLSLGEAAVHRAASLTQRLLAFSRKQTLDPRATDVNQLVKGMEELIARTIGPSVHLEATCADQLWSVLVDPPQLENALLNLCINARDAMPAGGRLTLETANVVLDAAAAALCDLPVGPYVTLSVADTGMGMTDEVIARAFDPFFTTKAIGEGSGLGLSMIYGFARQSGGQVRIASTLGAGSKLTIYLPRHEGTPIKEQSSASAPALEHAGKRETILVVEDEPSIREMVCEILQSDGYTVLHAGDGSAGLRILQSDAHIDLLVTDVGLPGAMNGRQMVDTARMTRSQLIVLFITGYAETSTVGNGHMAPGMHVLTKPFSLKALRQKIGSLLPI